MIGPAIAGMLIASVGTGWAFLINGASYIAVLCALGLLRVEALHRGRKAAGGRGAWRKALAMYRSAPI